MLHDLFDFFKEANHNIEAEYNRIYRSTSEDPGTAGDQGEENWKRILEQWIPQYFHIETKGRILFENGETSPQVDIIILSPEYPKQLYGCKRYLSGGVVAAFECKTTLRREHIKELMTTSKIISELAKHDDGTIRKDLQSPIYYGLLAHSHSWKAENSNPIENITNALIEYNNSIITHPIHLPDLICVADLGVWQCSKTVIPKQKGGLGRIFDHDSVRGGYIEFSGKQLSLEGAFSPIGAMIFMVLNHLAWKYDGLRDIVSYMRKLNVSGSGEGLQREWGFDVFSEQTLIGMMKNGITNGGFYNEWGMNVN